MEPARSVNLQQTQGYLPQTQDLTFEEISKLDLTKIEHSDHNNAPNTPRPSYLYDIFQSQIVNNLEGLTDYLKSSKIHKEIRLNGCEITNAIAERIFFAILSNHTFTTLTFKNGKIDTAVFNVLRNLIHNYSNTVNNIVFTDVELSCESLALLINGLQKHQNSKLSFQNCRLSDTDDLSKFYEFLHMTESESDVFKEINRANRAWLEQANPFFVEERYPMTIELINFSANPDMFLAIKEELLKCNLSMLHIESTNPGHRKLNDISLLKPNTKFLQKAEMENEVLSADIPERSTFLLNERSFRILKYYNIKLLASELVGIIQGIQKHENYRLRLENCKIIFENEEGIENFIEQLSVRNPKNANPLVLELIKVRTDLQKGFPGLIKGLLGCNISLLHSQNCNLNSAAAELKNGLMSHNCTLDTLQVVQDQFEVLSFHDIVWGIVMQNSHPNPLSYCTFDDCQLNLTHSKDLETLIQNAIHLSCLGLPNNQLGSKIIVPYGRRRNSSGSTMPFKKELSGELKKTPPPKSIQPMHPIDSLARGLEARLSNSNAEYLYLNLSFNDLTGTNVNTIVNSIKKFLPKSVEKSDESEIIQNSSEEPSDFDENPAMLKVGPESTGPIALNDTPVEKPKIFVNLCGNNAQEKLDQAVSDLLITKKSSPRSIAIPHTRPTDNAAENQSQKLNSDYIASTPRDSSYNPTTPRATVISPRASNTSSPRRQAERKETGSTG